MRRTSTEGCSALTFIGLKARARFYSGSETKSCPARNTRAQIEHAFRTAPAPSMFAASYIDGFTSTSPNCEFGPQVTA